MKTDVISVTCTDCEYIYTYRYMPYSCKELSKRNAKCPQCGHDNIVVV